MEDTKNKIGPYCFPMLVSEYTEKDDSNKEIMERWAKFDTISENKKNVLISENIGVNIKKIQETFWLSEDLTRIISRNIRKIFFGEIQLQNFPQILSREMEIDITTAQKISEIIIQKIINDDSQEKVYQSQLIRISFSDALRKYLEVGEQLITLNHIILKNFPEPVRPSIKNWIADYTYNAGYNRHTSLERGNYLFQNENAKKLGYSDKEKLSFILKAYDDNLPVEINLNTKQIIFPSKEIQKTENTLRFTSPQKMSFENKNSAFQKPTFSSNTNFRNNTVPPTNVINLKKQ